MTRRRRLATRMATAALLAGLLAGCTTSTGASDPATTTTSADATATGSCRPVERPPLQVSSHLVGDAEPPGDFSSVPATSGWHTSRVPDPGTHDQPLRDAEIVSALESGIVVVAIAPALLADSGDVLDELATQFPERLLVTPYPADMPTPVALLTWGALQRCDTVDPAATTAFVLGERVAAEGH